jgi:hypothetical protein
MQNSSTHTAGRSFGFAIVCRCRFRNRRTHDTTNRGCTCGIEPASTSASATNIMKNSGNRDYDDDDDVRIEQQEQKDEAKSMMTCDTWPTLHTTRQANDKKHMSHKHKTRRNSLYLWDRSIIIMSDVINMDIAIIIAIITMPLTFCWTIWGISRICVGTIWCPRQRHQPL